MIRRIIDADNSCLFNAVGYTLRRKRKVGTELRQMITQAVRGDPFTYTEVRESALISHRFELRAGQDHSSQESALLWNTVSFFLTVNGVGALFYSSVTFRTSVPRMGMP